MNQEPVALSALISTALIVTVNLLALIFGWAEELVVAVNIAIAAWVAVAGWFVRRLVTPVRST